MALLLRSRLESNRSRTVERSVLQLQALVDQFPLEESSVSERLLYFFCIDIPAKWDMEVCFFLIKLQIRLGMDASAFKLFFCRRFVYCLRCPFLSNNLLQYCGIIVHQKPGLFIHPSVSGASNDRNIFFNFF